VDGADEVSAPLDATVRTGATVRVKLAHPVTVDVDGKERTVQTTASTVGELSEQLGLSDDAELSLGRDVTLASSTSPLSVVTPKHVSVDLGGKRLNVSTTATDVEDLLKEHGIKPDADDVVSPSLNTVLTDGAQVTWQKVQVRKASSTKEVPAGTLSVKTDDLDKGKVKTVQAGSAGERTTVVQERYVNGKLVSSSLVSSSLTKKPVAKLVQVGTKVASSSSSDADDSSDSSDSSSKDDSSKSSSSSSSGGSVSGVWQKLAQCESGGNWSANTGNGFYGGLQFTASTWAAQGGTKYAALPSQASASEQVAIASKLQKAAGWGQWPACTAKLGLR
jgi:uncharacterized protein YabE (DUF348 family)